MTTAYRNGPVFPVSTAVYSTDELVNKYDPRAGITVRTHISIAAMAAILGNSAYEMNAQQIATFSVGMADVLVKELNKP